MPCFWCDKETDHLTDDHIVPRSLGGTLDFTVQSCLSCQTELSKAEHEVARKSNLAIHALVSPVRPRHPNRSTSGHLKPSYLLVKHPLGGYGESLLCAGEKMRSLAHLEIRVAEGESLEGRIRGPSPAEAQLLLDLLRKALQLQKKLAPGELVCEITANLDIDPEIASDPDFWPRIVLLPGNRLMLRARDPEELVRFAKALELVARSDYRVDPSKWGNDVRIISGTTHKIALRFDPQCVRRIAAKIAYALFCSLAKRRIQSDEDKLMRFYILGAETSPDEPVSITPDSAGWTTSSDEHYIVLSPKHDKSAAFVCLYGCHFRVELGRAAILPETTGVICEIDGSGMRIGTDEEILRFTERIKTTTFSQPWLKPELSGEH